MTNEPQRSEQRRHASDAITAAIADPMPLDEWRKRKLCSAVSALYCGLYRLAAVEAELSQAPADSRVELPPDPDMRNISRELLREALADTMAEPVRLRPVFRLA